MIEIIVSLDSDARRTEKETLLKKYPGAIVLDDSMATFESLQSYAYPSLFDEQVPIVVASFMVEAGEPTKQTAQILAASPTQFFLFERMLTTDAKKLLSKYGAVKMIDGKVVKKPASSLFYDASALVTESNKLKRWQKLQTLLQTEVPEAFIGIVYWKLRDLATKSDSQSGPQKENARKMYDALITAHAAAWISGTPLANAIEKVVLSC